MQVIHHHHHHHHHEAEGGKISLKSIGRDLKKTFTAKNAENAAYAAIPALTTSLGAAAGGPLGAAAGAATGYLADKGLQNAIHGSGFYHKKHSKYQDAAYKKKVHDAMALLRSKRTTQFAKGSDEAKAYMAKLRAMRNVTVHAIHGSGYKKGHANYTDEYHEKIKGIMAAARAKRGPAKARFAKGSDEAKAHMAKIRAMKKSSQKNVTVRKKKSGKTSAEWNDWAYGVD